MRSEQSLSSLTARLLNVLEDYFKNQIPDIVIGHGDTTTCFATALSSFYQRIPFFHVEAGLRTFKLETPFPEEFNRQSISPLAYHHFAPTETERQNLLNEGIQSSSITVIGSTAHESVELVRAKVDFEKNQLPFELPENKKIVTVTLHRRENIQSLNSILEGVRLAARTRKDALFICPVHPNPLVQMAFKKCLSKLNNIHLVEPLRYPDFISLLLRSHLVLTDSGGVQEEGAYLGKRILIARSETERLDGISQGLVSVIGTSSTQVFSSLSKNIDAVKKSLQFERPIRNASEIVADRIEKATV